MYVYHFAVHLKLHNVVNQLSFDKKYKDLGLESRGLPTLHNKYCQLQVQNTVFFSSTVFYTLKSSSPYFISCLKCFQIKDSSKTGNISLLYLRIIYMQGRAQLSCTWLSEYNHHSGSGYIAFRAQKTLLCSSQQFIFFFIPLTFFLIKIKVRNNNTQLCSIH